jgi:magnesium chelatase accessory protein
MGDRLTWASDGQDWPNRAASRFVEAAGLRWHVQTMGRGPDLLLVHGTGAATHSWRALMPLLAARFAVTAMDLPGHGFTSAPKQSCDLSLPGMARAVAALVAQLGLEPEIAVGHSAGAAILIRMKLDGALAADDIVSLNGALFPFRQAAGHIFSPLAKLLFLNPFAPRVFAWNVGPGVTRKLLAGTGSAIDEAGLDSYVRLFRSPGHVAAALGMMANWDLASFATELPRLRARLTLVAGDRDLAVSPELAFKARDLAPRSQVVRLRALGHLAHEERPDEIATLIAGIADSGDAALLPRAPARRVAGKAAS